MIRPRRLTLREWEKLATEHRALSRRLLAQPQHLAAVARAILRQDSVARERFGDAETLVRYLMARLSR